MNSISDWVDTHLFSYCSGRVGVITYHPFLLYFYFLFSILVGAFISQLLCMRLDLRFWFVRLHFPFFFF